MKQEDKYIHEFRDPIHVFIKMNSKEREVVDSIPLQRLRHIHQLGLSYLVYPGATHKRFEHSLGVMEVATRIFDTITDTYNITDAIKNHLKELHDPGEVTNARKLLRMAALCHDIGHLPFSHAAEKDLLPKGWNHERITEELILSDMMSDIWEKVGLSGKIIAKLAVGLRESRFVDDFTPWETILSEIITGDMFGADRIDYLLRDSLHAGVAYGKFDHFRLIDTMRILIDPENEMPVLGIQEGGKHSVEALVLARYFMFTQVYYHPIRLIYDEHLKDFLREWLEDGQYRIDLDDHLHITDNEVITGLRKATMERGFNGHFPALIISQRKHFRKAFERNQEMVRSEPDALKNLSMNLQEEIGVENVKYVKTPGKEVAIDFLIERDDGTIENSKLSRVIEKLPPIIEEYIYVPKLKLAEARKWLKQHQDSAIKPREEK